MHSKIANRAAVTPDASPETQNPRAVVGKILIEACMSPMIIERLNAPGPYGLVVDVSNEDYLGVVGDALEAVLSPDDVVVTTSIPATVVEASLLLDALKGGRVRVVVTALARNVPASFRAWADETIAVPELDEAMLRAALERIYGVQVPDFPNDFQVHPKPELVARCIIPEFPADRVVAALARLGGTRPTKEAETLPHLAECREYGEAQLWGLDVIEDILRWKAGELKADDIDNACLLVGPPGCGKTHFARLMAAAMDAPLFELTAGKLFVNTGHLGDVMGEMRRRFETATAAAPSVLLLDEIDSFSRRDAESDNGFAVTMTNELLSLLDGLDRRHPGLVVIAATNRLDAVEPALLRPGRLSRQIVMKSPDRDGLEHVLRTLLRGDLADESLDYIVRLSRGSTPARLAGLIKNARRAARSRGTGLTVSDLVHELLGDQIVDRGMLYRIAVHEAGHALACLTISDAPMLDSVRLGITTETLGAVRSHERPGPMTKSRIEGKVMLCLAGRAAENVFYGPSDPSDGGSQDFKDATALVVRMHSQWGMADTLFHTDDLKQLMLLDRRLAKAVERDLQRLMASVTETMTAYKSQLVVVAAELARKRCLEAEEVAEIVQTATDADWQFTVPGDEISAMH